MRYCDIFIFICLFTQSTAISECSQVNQNFIQTKRSTRPTIKSLKYVQKKSAFKHQSIKGYNCSIFLRINELSHCCEGRNDNCYMINNQNSRCYCDEFCVEKHNTHNDCCPDAVYKCAFNHTNTPYVYKQNKNSERSYTLEETKLFEEFRSSLRYLLSNGTIIEESSGKKFIHGDRENELYGGSCTEFFKLNNLTTCCADRNDDCYMKHYTTRCYCDNFCDRRPDNSDCCTDAFQKCSSSKSNDSFEDETTSLQETKLNCTQNDSIIDNCNKCSCINGYFQCTKFDCLSDAQLINEINNDESIGWKANNYSQFWGKTFEYAYVHKLGTKLKHKQIKNFNYDYHNMEPFNFRESLVNSSRLFSVKDQGECGASFAFSTLDVASDRAALHIRKLTNQNASAQHLLACMTQMNQVKNCTANTVESAWDFLLVKMYDNNTIKLGGVVDDTCYPYTSQKGQIAKCKIPNLSKFKCGGTNRKKLFRISSSYEVNSHNISSIMKEIKKNGPVQMIFKVYSDFFLYKSGVYTKHPKAKLVNDLAYHSVNVYGWNYTSNGVPYWYAVNSWGTEWGESGYFKIRMDDIETEIGQHVYAAYSTYAY